MTNRGRFHTTRWSLVLAAGRRDSAGAEAALAALCETYWFPIYAFIRRSGHPDDAARDLTQAFFEQMLDKNTVKAADPARGRFRSFLLASVRNFLSNQYDASMRLKRGGGVHHLPLEFEEGERRYRHEPGHSDTPERLYERRWAQTVLDQTMARLAVHYEKTGRRDWFAHLRPSITGDDAVPHAAIASALGLSDGAVRVAIHRLRRRFAQTLREVIAETVEDPESVDDELGYLTSIVSR